MCGIDMSMCIPFNNLIYLFIYMYYLCTHTHIYHKKIKNNIKYYTVKHYSTAVYYTLYSIHCMLYSIYTIYIYIYTVNSR